MVNIKLTNLIHQSECVHTRVRNIAGELNQSLTNRKFHLLTRKLDATLKILNTIKEQSVASVFANGTTEALENEIVTLYGRIIDAWVENEVHQIQNEASNIENALLNGKVTAKVVQKLACHLQSFKNEHRPSLEQRRVLAEAEHIMTQAHAFLKGDRPAHIQSPSSTQTQICKKAGDVTAVEANDVTAFEDLMDIASCIYNGDLRQAKMKYLQLPEEHKKGFLKHVHFLGATPFTNPFESIQACIALANELIGNGEGYPTQVEINELFLDLFQVNLQERAACDKIFSLRSTGSLGG